MATFKIEFNAEGIVTDNLARTEENEELSQQSIQQTGDRDSAVEVQNINKKKIKTWFLSLGEPETSTKQPTLDDWVSKVILINAVVEKHCLFCTTKESSI